MEWTQIFGPNSHEPFHVEQNVDLAQGLLSCWISESHLRARSAEIKATSISQKDRMANGAGMACFMATEESITLSLRI
jgi:hypothetical protein